MKLLSWFQNWNFDIASAAVAIFSLPILLYFAALIRKSLKSWGTFLIEGALYYLGKSINSGLSGHLALKRYARLKLGEETRFLHVPSSQDIKLSVDRAFVPLTLEHHGGEEKNYDHSNFLSLGNRIRLIGDPGSGKSSLIKRLLRDTCFKALERPKSAQLPILIELKTLKVPTKRDSNELGNWFFQKLRIDIGKSNVYQMQTCFDSYAGDRGLLVLLDGLDEVSSDDYPKVQSAIVGLDKKLAQLSEKNTIVITMRAQFHQQVKDEYRDNFGSALFLRPFTPKDIYDFLLRWPFSEEAQSNISRIYKELTDRPSLREMCGNPLILSMYVAEDQAHANVVAPDSRTDFYRKVTEELILKRRLKQIGGTAAPTKLKEQRERILGRIAFDHMLNVNQSANSLIWKRAIEITQDVMKCSEAEAEIKFRELSKETGLVTEERPGESFCFIHLTFCEFLAAHEAIEGQKNGWSELIAAHKQHLDGEHANLRSRLLEVIPFACGLLSRVDREKSIADVASLGNNGLLGRCFLETKLYEHLAWASYVEGEKRALQESPEASWDTEWLRKLHLFNVIIRDAEECAVHIGGISTPLDLDEFFHTLVKQQQASLSTLVNAYASQDAAAALRLAEVSNLDIIDDFPEVIVRNCDQVPFFALLLEQAAKETHRAAAWAWLLGSAALNTGVVRQRMWDAEPLPAWEALAANSPKAKRWDDSRFLKRNLLTQCLTIAGQAPLSTPPKMLIGHVLAIPAPGRYRLEERLFDAMGLLAFPSVLLLLWGLATDNSLSMSLKGLSIVASPLIAVTIGFAFVTFLFLYAISLRYLLLKIFYRRIVLPFSRAPASNVEPLVTAVSVILKSLIKTSVRQSVSVGSGPGLHDAISLEYQNRPGDLLMKNPLTIVLPRDFKIAVANVINRRSELRVSSVRSM